MTATAGAVVVAAGRSRRYGQDKLFLPLAGLPVLARALRAFEDCPAIGEVALVLNTDNLERGRQLVEQHGLAKVRHFLLGGVRRQDSVLAGLEALGRWEWIAIHDGARPLVTPELIERGIAAAAATGAAVPGVRIKDTVKLVGADQRVESTPERAGLRAIQTPQVFRRELILGAYQQASGEVTDDAALVEALGDAVVVFAGSDDNLKITTPEDVDLAELLLRRRGGH